MEKISLREVAEAVNGKIINGGNMEGFISGVSIDSRTIEKGQLFIPIIGDRFDGHDFIENSIQQGAAAVLTHKLNLEIDSVPVVLVENTFKAMHDLARWYRRKFHIPVICVTGSTGKTTVKDLIAAVLEKKYKVLKTQGNYNNEIGMPLSIFNLNHSHEMLVLEMGMSGFGEIERMVEIADPDIGVITNIGVSHIEHLGSRENILKAKLELFSRFDKDSTAIINGDDSLLYALRGKFGFNTLFFGIKQDSRVQKELDIIAEDISIMRDKGSVFSVEYKDEIIDEIYIPLMGIHSIYNCLPAILIGIIYDIDETSIKKALEDYRPPEMRMNVMDLSENIKVIDDTYNASPDSVKAAVNVLKSIAGGRTIAVLGDMLELGNYTEEWHIQVGRYIACKHVDYLLAVGENAECIAKGAVEAGLATHRIKCHKYNKDVIKNLYKLIENGDTILVKGSRGMKMEEIVESLKRGDGVI